MLSRQRHKLTVSGDLVLHAAVMAPPSKKATELVAYLVKQCPEVLNTKSVQQMTPLAVACLLGRVEAAKVLIDAGADQTIKSEGWKNLLHSALHFTPTVSEFKPLLRLLNAQLVERMFRERSNLEQLGRTPLHQWIAEAAFSWKANIYSEGEMVKMFKLLLGISPSATDRALRMLDSAGDTPLHSLVLNDSSRSLELARVVVEHDPELLFRENAVGRTPIEVARERFIASRIQQPNYPNYYPDKSVATWLRASPEEFVKKNDEGDAKEHEDSSNVAKLWRLCEETLAKFPELPKRQLVSLHEANDVAKRLGEQHMRFRYQFSIKNSPSSDNENACGPEGEKKQRRRHSDIVQREVLGRGDEWNKEKEKYEKSSGSKSSDASDASEEEEE